jgi:nucleotide-binding universal stress UspA family protein
MKIFIALDSSPQSEAIISEVARRPWPKDTVFRVIQVVDSMLTAQLLSYYPPRVKEEHEQARAFVQAAAERLQERGLETAAYLIEGDPRTSIVDYARQWGTDFIIVGSHGHGLVARLLLGSVARSVLDHAHCSVEIVRAASRESDAEKGGPVKLLLGTDGSEFSAAAIRSVLARPWPEGSEVKVVSVVDLIVPVTDPWYAAGEVMDRIHQGSIKLAEEAVIHAKQMLAGSGLKVTAHVVSGSPKWQLIDEAKAWGADLIVVGSHGRRGLTRLVLGSVSSTVALHAHCLVDVIREPALLHK